MVSTSPTSGWLTPERVSHAEFRSGFRGLDPAEVRAFLARVASELRTMQEREADLLAQLEQAEDRGSAVTPAPLDLHQVTSLLGQETARVLETAREAAADIKARAESDADAIIAAATAEAERVRGDAEGVLGERTTEAEAAAAEIVAGAEAEAARIAADAEEAADLLRQQAADEAERLVAEAEATRTAAEEDAARISADAAEAATELRERASAEAERMVAEAEAARASAVAEGDAARDAAKEEGRRMVVEARAVRERILTDMARRRNVARQQLERVRAAREVLLDALEKVREGVTDVQSELSGSLVEAKLAGDRGARTIDVEDLPTLRDLDAEVEMAKDTGLIDLTALDSRDDELSAMDTGEFSAVQVAADPAPAELAEADEPLPAGEAPSEPDPAEASELGEGVTGADAVEAVDVADDAAAGSVGALDEAPSVFTRERDVRDDAAPAEHTGPADAETAPETAPEVEVEAQAVGSGDQPAPMRFGTIQVVPLRSDIALPAIDEVVTAAAHDADTDADTADTGEGVVIDLRDAADPAEPAAGADPDVDPEVGTGPDEGPSGGGAGAKSAGRRASRKAKAPKKADELFARLRAADEGGPGNGRDLNGKGPAAVIGVAVADRASVASDPTAGLSATTGVGITGRLDAIADLDRGAVEVDDDLELGGADRVALHTRDAVLAGTLRDLSRQLKLALSDQQNELLEAGRSTKGKEQPTIPSAEEMAAIYIAAARDELATAMSLGRRSIKPDDRAAAKAADVDRQAEALGRAVVDTLRQRLATAEDAGNAGDELWAVDRVRAAYREVRSQRLAELVSYHVFAAYATGQLAAAPKGAQARWVCDACGPDCLDNALAGPQRFGEKFPTGHLAPPAFAGCRCTLVSATEDPAGA